MKLISDLKGTASSAVWYVLLVLVLPLASLSALGLLYLWEHKGLLAVTVGWLLVTATGYVLISLKARRDMRDKAALGANFDANNVTKPVPEESLPEQLDTPADWTPEDIDIWKHYCKVIDALVADDPPWEELPTVSMQLLSRLANTYQTPQDAPLSQRDIYRFTMPEALHVLSIASARYRKLLLAHVPFADKINVSSLLGWYEHKPTLQTGWGWLNKTRRLLRLTNPIAAAVGELRDQFTNRLFTKFRVNLQADLKRLLLQEVVQAGMDLYSGRLKHSDEEMLVYQSESQRGDQSQLAQAHEPMRVVLLGQTNAGKSSLINALIQAIEADVDQLVATDNTRTHVLTLTEAGDEPAHLPNVSHCVHLIDTPGLNGSEKQVEFLAHYAINADLIVCVAKANQPARSQDKKLMSVIQEQFSQQPRRRQPQIVLALTHIDQLSPRSEWAPPYDLNSDSGKVRSIVQALASAAKQIGLPSDSAAIPLCLSADKASYNVDAMTAQLLMLREQAILTQLNRRRLERGDQSVLWGEQWNALVRLGRAVGRAVSRSNR